MRNICIFDIDGTLSDPMRRLHHIEKTPKDWDSFFEAAPQDPVMEDTRLLLWSVQGMLDIKVYLFTGRSDEYRRPTEIWLKSNGIQYDGLYMRKEGDKRVDCEVKYEMLEEAGIDDLNVWFVVEDRRSVVDMWRDLGITVYQCAKGEF